MRWETLAENARSIMRSAADEARPLLEEAQRLRLAELDRVTRLQPMVARPDLGPEIQRFFAVCRVRGVHLVVSVIAETESDALVLLETALPEAEEVIGKAEWGVSRSGTLYGRSSGKCRRFDIWWDGKMSVWETACLFDSLCRQCPDPSEE